MFPGLSGAIHGAIVIIEFGGGLFAVAGCMRALAVLVIERGHLAGIVRARILVADGVIAALGFKTAATLLRTTKRWGQPCRSSSWEGSLPIAGG